MSSECGFRYETDDLTIALGHGPTRFQHCRISTMDHPRNLFTDNGDRRPIRTGKVQRDLRRTRRWKPEPQRTDPMEAHRCCPLSSYCCRYPSRIRLIARGETDIISDQRPASPDNDGPERWRWLAQIGQHPVKVRYPSPLRCSPDSPTDLRQGARPVCTRGRSIEIDTQTDLERQRRGYPAGEYGTFA